MNEKDFLDLVERNRIKFSVMLRAQYRMEWEDIRDHYQECCLKLWKLNVEGKLDDVGYPDTYLGRIAINLFIDKYRKSKIKIKPFYSDDGRQSRVVDQTPGAQPQQVKKYEDMVQDLEVILSKIGKKKGVLELRMQGYSYNEIAEREGIALGTVMSRLHHARKKVEDMLRERGWIIDS